MKAADAAAIRGGVPSLELMENAARALVEELCARYPGWRRVVVVCGPGNNGGDGLAAARLLAGRGVKAEVFSLADPAAYRGDAAENALAARAYGLDISALSQRGGRGRLATALAEADGAVDALFGTGLSRGLSGSAAAVVAALNSSGRGVVAADLPSGLSADTGAMLGPCVRADLTVAFAAPKLCHLFFPARQMCGTVVVRAIGIPRKVLGRVSGKIELVEPEDVRRLLPPRPLDAHKGDCGRLAVIAGSRGKTGAAVLCARAALRSGAGLVTVFCPKSLEQAVVTALPETMTRGFDEKRGALASKAGKALAQELAGFDAAAVGPGLGTSAGTVSALEELVRRSSLPMVGDADFLNVFAGRASALSRRNGPTVLTPHPGEAARLLGAAVREVQANRSRAAAALARSTRAVVVLKGAGSLTATPDGRIAANPTGTPLLATAGSGDVLTGAIGALLAGGLPAREAAYAGVYLHGAAAERLALRLGDAGLLTADLADALPLARRALVREAGDGRR
jgi:hydroxyethylthiazole kinase-like uncharacterized protein yjeF